MQVLWWKLEFFVKFQLYGNFNRKSHGWFDFKAELLSKLYVFYNISTFFRLSCYIYFKIRYPDSKEFKGNLLTSGPVQLIWVQFSLKRWITKRKRGCFIRSPGLLSLAQFSSDDCIVRLCVPLPTLPTSSPFVLFPLCRPFRCPIPF